MFVATCEFHVGQKLEATAIAAGDIGKLIVDGGHLAAECADEVRLLFVSRGR